MESIKHGKAHLPELRGYKAVCAKLGLSMCVFYIYRLIAGITLSSIFLTVKDSLNPVLYSVLYYLMIIIMTYIIPLSFTVFIFRYSPPLRKLYRKPRRVARALGVFPAAYGIALLTMLVTYIVMKTLGLEIPIEGLLRPPNVGETRSVTELVMITVLIVVAAPIFEEYWVRGVMFDALRPYGAGMAIIISSILFGLMHGSLYMLFYTTAFGLALGYVRYATGSLFIVTILHALVNSVSATALLLISLADMTNAQNRVLNTTQMIFVVFVLILIIVGITVFFAKIPTIRKYRFENPWTEIGPLKKIGVFLISIPVIIMMLLAFNELSGQMLIDMISKGLGRQ